MKGKEENNPPRPRPRRRNPGEKTAAPGVADKVDDGTGDGQRSARSRREKTLGSSAQMKLETVSAAAKQVIQHG